MRAQRTIRGMGPSNSTVEERNYSRSCVLIVSLSFRTQRICHSEGVAEESACPRARNNLRAHARFARGTDEGVRPYTIISTLLPALRGPTFPSSPQLRKYSGENPARPRWGTERALPGRTSSDIRPCPSDRTRRRVGLFVLKIRGRQARHSNRKRLPGFRRCPATSPH